MYLGYTNTKAGYLPQFAAKPKKAWRSWLTLTDYEAKQVSRLQHAIKEARLAPNLPTQLNLLARVNSIKSELERDTGLAAIVRESALELF